MKFLTLTSIILAIMVSVPSYSAENAQQDVPYNCDKLQLKKAIGVLPDSKMHSYLFSGSCQMRTSLKPLQYQEVAVEIQATYDVESKTGREYLTTPDDKNAVVSMILSCKEDPWLTSSKCVVKNIQNTTSYPTFSNEFSSDNKTHPPVATDMANAKEASKLSQEYKDKKAKALSSASKENSMCTFN